MHIWACAHARLSFGGSLRSSGGQYWAGSLELPGCELLAAATVPGLKQLTNTRLPLLSPLSPPPLHLSAQFLALLAFTFFPFHPLISPPLSHFPLLSFPPPEALLGSALEPETESGSVGQLRQQAQAGCALGVTWVLLVPQSCSAHSS